jgi:3-phytase
LDLLAVVERDNARVQFFTPAGKPVGIVGAGKLNRPYGAAVSRGRGEVQLYVTDTEVPPAETVKVFRLAWRDGRAEGRWLRSFGASDGPGRLHSVESIVVDDAHDRVYVADEDRWNRGIQIYTRDGRFTGRALGTDLFDADPEGLALIDAPGGGWLIATEQGEVRTVWHAFGRGDYARVGSFSGSGGIANTDGVAVWPHPLEGFGGGAFFAVHDDAGIRAYRLEEIRAAVANPENPRSIEAVAGASPVR